VTVKRRYGPLSLSCLRIFLISLNLCVHVLNMHEIFDVNQPIIDNQLYFLLQFLKLFRDDQTCREKKILPSFNVLSCNTPVLDKCMKTLTLDVGIGVQTHVSDVKLEVRSQCS